MGVAVDIDGQGVVSDIEDDVMIGLAMAADDQQAAEAGTQLLERYEGMIRSIAAQHCNRSDIVEELVVSGFAATLDALDAYTPAAVGVTVPIFIEVSIRNAVHAEAARLMAAQ